MGLPMAWLGWPFYKLHFISENIFVSLIGFSGWTGGSNFPTMQA
jgi:hypothetical protein